MIIGGISSVFIFSMGIPIKKSLSGLRRTGFLLLIRSSLELKIPSSSNIKGIVVRMFP